MTVYELPNGEVTKPNLVVDIIETNQLVAVLLVFALNFTCLNIVECIKQIDVAQ